MYTKYCLHISEKSINSRNAPKYIFLHIIYIENTFKGYKYAYFYMVGKSLGIKKILSSKTRQKLHKIREDKQNIVFFKCFDHEGINKNYK